ncbi:MULTISPECIES: ABC transporter ATP-binding protein [unclassified Streptomyces]|uniref:ABC transporter ATP-binding protein n=1 Tax=unclassified Streptomyces TaxID=2593676 RepID=UPI0001C18EA4|nr:MULTISPECIES: ABC transporter ATP-binding protein [unclassified Streptomyces]MYR64783.1 ATP-binding cassette domain-containing protein [Streptomyces sp. SID4939]MYS01542.1 ATP-binding cassette domain-containing protein [Streptomyces sp. SID4940]MYT64319.1 ATP-binding cassette domain-containing protein [Streptomyces sp. SID8357]MYT87132.1 ATP-binding cassette domain-containing protein [Streptomyces sp. SID8360]MYU34578.1 ATP-binding cassette domain-containing protein [Streptomyces sp. SID835
MLIKLLRTYLGPYRRPILLLVALQFLQTCASLYLPSLNADIIDNGVVQGDTGYILEFGGVMIAVSVVQVLCNVGAVYFGARTASALGRDVRASVFSRVQSFSAREVGRFGAPSLITRTTNDVQQIQMLVLMSFTLMVSAPIMCVGGIVMALGQDVKLSAVLLAVVPVLGIAVSLIVKRMRPLFRTMQTRLDTVNRVLREQITGNRVIRAFVRDDYEEKRFGGANTELTAVALSTGRLMALMFPTVMTVVNVSSVAVVWFGAHRIDSGGMEIGALTAFIAYLMQIVMSVMMATFMFMMVPRAEVCAERIQEVLETESSVVPPKDPVTELRTHGHLEIRGAEFRYPGAEEPVLRSVDLVARPGETTAVIGSTGSGKSTLLGLVPRLFDATGGDVLVGGRDVRTLDPALLARSVSLVPQKPYLFSGTVATNLRYGNPDATDEELWHALEVAQAKEFVERLEHGLDAPIAQGGTNVSGGQRQRLAIARTLVQRPEIYLFDDSFSALDYATDAALRSALSRETAGATVVIVAQRVSTIRDADRILVLDEGRVVGAGSHHELMDGNETYREIVLSQLTEAEAA